MKPRLLAVVILTFAFFTGLILTFFYLQLTRPPQGSTVREYTLSGAANVPTGTIAASIMGSISINGTIPAGSTLNIEARETGTWQYSTVLQNLPAKPSQTFSYTKATSGASYDMKVTLLDPTSKVIGESDSLTVPAPSLNVQFSLSPATPSATPTPKPIPSTTPTNSTPTSTTAVPTLTPTPTAGLTTISGNISFQGVAPINSRIVILEKLANASSYLVAVDNLVPLNGTTWQWTSALSGNSYTVIAVLKQKSTDGKSDIDLATSAPTTVTAPATSIVLTVNSSYSLTKPTGTSSVTCVTYNSVPNNWNVTVNFPAFSGALSYWLEVGTTDGGFDLVNSYGSALTASTVFKNNTTYFARYAYAAVAGVDTGSGQYSAFSDTTRLICGN